MDTSRTFLEDTLHYGRRIRLFGRVDWQVYFVWVGMMVGLLFAVSFFLSVGQLRGVSFPAYVWNIPLGILIFTLAIGFDTIGHRTVYKEALKKGEDLVHHITIFAGITSIFLLCLAYTFPVFLRIPSLIFVLLSVFYSIIDEAMHWFRYHSGNSDRVEMWSHFFIFVGHNIMVLAWWHWFDQGYPGVSETLKVW